MTRRSLAVLALSLLAAAITCFAPAAGAAAPVSVGWWTSAPFAGMPFGPGALVPDGAVQVAYGLGGPTSVAAVRLPAGPGGAAFTLPLSAYSSPYSFTVAACPTTTAWQHADGGPIAHAPKWDCTRRVAVAAYDPAARTLRWDFGGDFASGGFIDVALVPVAGSQPFVATSTVPDAASDRPAGGAVTPEPAPTAEGHPAPAPPDTALAPPDTAPVPPDTAPAYLVPAAPVPAVTPSLSRPAASAPSPLSPLPTPAEVRRAAVRPPGVPGAGRAVGLALLVAVAAAPAAVWAGRRRREPDPARGVGRFRSPRTADPDPV